MNSGGGGTVGVGGGMTGGTGGGVVMSSSFSPFTVSQRQELEHQALIFKYMMAGLPVPPDLVLPIQKSFESISHRFLHHPNVGFCSLYGKKVDPEPGRCRRTDGKKWRCSKDAYPDSKYCERHMHRGRNRSRKPVESQTMMQSSSTMTSLTVSGSSSGAGSFQSAPLHSLVNFQGIGSGTNQSHYNFDSVPYGIPSKDYRFVQGLKSEAGEHSFFSEASGSNRGLQIESQLGRWPLMQSQVSSFTVAKSTDSSIMQNDYPQHSYYSGGFASGEPGKQSGQSLRPFLDEWPKTQDSWSGLRDDKSNRTSISTTRLSISTPMASSDLSTPGSHSPHDK